MDKWHKIWSKTSRVDNAILDCLIKANGFDSGPGSFTVEEWLSYTKRLYGLLAIEPGHSVYEVGCGAGAFLYPLYRKGFQVAGLDYSKELVELGNRLIAGEPFICADAENLETREKYDFVISHSIFSYFENLTKAENVITSMIAKCERRVGILDVCDEEKQQEYERGREQSFENRGGTKEEYRIKYSDLKHLFYPKDFFLDLAGVHGLSVEIYDQDFSSYDNSAYRYNVVFSR